jgi:predicted GNAT superfamily acetyltransferase
MGSHMAGVLPPWRGTGLGLQLKLAQRQAILAQGATEWVTWTYDPLLRTNGLFNILRLGAVCNTYHVNLYGAMIDGLNAGWDSDRCQVDWWLASPRVVERALAPDRPAPRALPQGTAVLQPPTAANSHGGLASGALPLDGRAVAVPLPADIMALRAVDPELSNAWRYYMRGVLESAFAAGYLLADCVHVPEDGWCYLLAPGDEVKDL